AVAILLLVVVLFMPEFNGARRWINLGFGTFQPSEIAKFAVIVTFAQLIAINGNKMSTFKYGTLPFVILLAVIVGLMLLEPHLSGSILILSIGCIMMIAGGTNLKWFALAGGLVAVTVLVALFVPGVVDYAMSRVEYWIDPFSDPQGKGFQTI